jgi:hypothetical protein
VRRVKHEKKASQSKNVIELATIVGNGSQSSWGNTEELRKVHLRIAPPKNRKEEYLLSICNCSELSHVMLAFSYL